MLTDIFRIEPQMRRDITQRTNKNLTKDRLLLRIEYELEISIDLYLDNESYFQAITTIEPRK